MIFDADERLRIISFRNITDVVTRRCRHRRGTEKMDLTLCLCPGWYTIEDRRGAAKMELSPLLSPPKACAVRSVRLCYWHRMARLVISPSEAKFRRAGQRSVPGGTRLVPVWSLGQADAVVVVPVVRRVPVPVRRPGVLGGVVPTAAPEHAVRASDRLPQVL